MFVDVDVVPAVVGVVVVASVVFLCQGGCMLVMPVKLAPHVTPTGAYSFINGGSSSVGWLLKGGCHLMDPNADEDWNSDWIAYQVRVTW